MATGQRTKLTRQIGEHLVVSKLGRMGSFEYKIIRRDRRKTASIQVSPANEVSIIIPKDLPDDKIKSLIKRKTPWILSKIKFNKEVKYPHKPKEFVSGEAFQYLGRNYRLKVITGENEGVELKGGRLNVRILGGNCVSCDEKVKNLLTCWYIIKSEKKLRERTERLVERIGVSVRGVKVKSLKQRWGSCAKDGSIVFNWRIILAPITVVDYVVAHELCHRRFHDHSKEFWALLQRVMPDYREKKEWLRVNGAMMGM
ncbi:MAG: SprT family zinc-dependent metalloprotease [Victivallales bacterium]